MQNLVTLGLVIVHALVAILARLYSSPFNQGTFPQSVPVGQKQGRSTPSLQNREVIKCDHILETTPLCSVHDGLFRDQKSVSQKPLI